LAVFQISPAASPTLPILHPNRQLQATVGAVVAVAEVAPAHVPVLDVHAHALVEVVKYLIGFRLNRIEKNGIQSMAKTFPK
jgi:hypothetical protein